MFIKSILLEIAYYLENYAAFIALLGTRLIIPSKIMTLAAIKDKVLQDQRLDISEVELLYREAPMPLLAELATHVRGRFHAPNEATYLIMAIINYTNICVAKCDYCSFYRLPHQSGTYLLSIEQIFERIDAVINLGGTMVGFNGGFHPKLRIQDYANMFAAVRERYQDKIEFYGMTVAEFMFASRVSKLSYADAAHILKQHGSRWVTGGGAEILHDDFRRRHSPGKYKVEDYFAAQQAILESGMGSTATMVIGFDESLAERLFHLERLRQFQDQQSRKLASFLCWTYKPYNNELGGAEVSSEEYYRWIAIARIYLDNFQHIRTSVLTKNDAALVALQFGANDFDLPTEDEVTQKAGATISLNFDEILQGARALGFKPLHREPFPL